MTTTNKRIALIMLILILSAIGFYIWKSAPPATPSTTSPPSAGARAGGRNNAGQAIPVIAESVERGNIDIIINALGTVTAKNTALVKPRVDGLLQRIVFQEGHMVKAGELLAEIDPRAFQAQLDQARGQLARDEALLANARIDLERYKGLLAKESIARQQVDAQGALVKQYEGVVLADRGTVANASLQLGFTRVTAPISGRLGLRTVDVGNMVRASDAIGLVSITQTQPIMVVFSIPAEKLPSLQARLQAGATLSVEAWDREGSTALATGTLVSLDNQIDVTTSTVKLKAEFKNTDNRLFPNQFVNARLKVNTLENVLLVPAAAIQRGTPGTFVYALEGEEKKVRVKPVRLGANTAEKFVIESGLSPEDRVIVDGADKLRDGTLVETITPESRMASKPNPAANKKENSKPATEPAEKEAPPPTRARGGAETKANTEPAASSDTKTNAERKTNAESQANTETKPKADSENTPKAETPPSAAPKTETAAPRAP